MEENGKIDLVSIRDILDVESADTTNVSSIMHPVPHLNSGDSILYAASLMFRNRIRALPVYANHKLAGKITSASIIKKYVDSTGFKETLSKIMTADPTVLDASDSAAKARSIMMKRRFDQLPILKDGKLNGAITSETLVFSFLPLPVDRDSTGGWEEGRFGNSASSLAPVETTTNDIKDSPAEVLQNMLKFSNSLFFDSGGRCVEGIVTRDFLRLLRLEGEIQTIPVSIIGLPENPIEADLIESKFKAAVRLLQTMDPTVREAKVVIKNKEVNSSTMLHQVEVFVDGTEWHEDYEASGYEISKVFAEIDTWIRESRLDTIERPDRKKWQATRRHFDGNDL